MQKLVCLDMIIKLGKKLACLDIDEDTYWQLSCIDIDEQTYRSLHAHALVNIHNGQTCMPRL